MMRQFFRSLAVPCTSLGNQASGIEILLPSLKSTLSVSSVTVMFSAVGTSASTVEVRIPCLLKHFVAFVHQLSFVSGLFPRERIRRYFEGESGQAKTSRFCHRVRHERVWVRRGRPRRKRIGMDLFSRQLALVYPVNVFHT